MELSPWRCNKREGSSRSGVETFTYKSLSAHSPRVQIHVFQTEPCAPSPYLLTQKSVFVLIMIGNTYLNWTVENPNIKNSMKNEWRGGKPRFEALREKGRKETHRSLTPYHGLIQVLPSIQSSIRPIGDAGV